MNYWEIIADNLKKHGWSLGWLSAIDREGQRSGLLMHTAMTGKGLSLVAMKS